MADPYLKPIYLTCPTCHFRWLFMGNALSRTTCPYCKKTVPIRKAASEQDYINRLEEYSRLLEANYESTFTSRP